MKMQEIKKMATALGITAGLMKKSDLIRAIQSTEGNSPCFQTNATVTCGQKNGCWYDDCMSPR